RNGQAQKEWTFNALELSLREFTDTEDVRSLATVIDQGLSGKAHVLLEIVAHARIGNGQEVFPSQELILDRGDKKGQKSKTLYSVTDLAANVPQAAIHSQKIGNALRTIDTWYPDSQELGPIAVEP